MRCKDGERQTILMLLLDARPDQLSPTLKVDAIENLAGFLGMHTVFDPTTSFEKFEKFTPLLRGFSFGARGILIIQSLKKQLSAAR